MSIRIMLSEKIERKLFLGSNVEIDCVVITKPRVKDMLHVSAQASQEDMVKLISNCSNISYQEVLNLSIPDYTKISNAFNKMITPEQ